MTLGRRTSPAAHPIIASRPVGCFPLAASVRGRRFVGFVAEQEHGSAAQGRRRVSSGVDLSGGAKPARSRLQVHALDRGFAGRTFASQNTRRSSRRDGVEDAQTSGLSLWPTEARSETSSRPQRSCPCQTAKTKRFKKRKLATAPWHLSTVTKRNYISTPASAAAGLRVASV